MSSKGKFGKASVYSMQNKKLMKLIFTTLLMSLLSLSVLYAQKPVIHQLVPQAETAGLHEKFELVVDLTASYDNPYHYDDILIRAIFTAPGGRRDTVEGFYLQDYALDTQSGSLTGRGEGAFRVRFSPDETGTWVYVVTVQDRNGLSEGLTGRFECAVSESKGFIRRNETNYLSFDNGDQYIPVGENLAWQSGNTYFSYERWLGKLAENRANFIRLWLAHWGLGIEWRDGYRDFPGLGRYSPMNSWYLDWILEECREKDIYVMFCINHHGQVSSNVNPNWDENPYNAVLGGPCQTTSEFFTHPAARDLHRNRLRYILARWGYSPNIMAWELFNEVNFTDGYDNEPVKTAVRAWHDEMSRFLKAKDVRGHLVTTSLSTEKDPQIWDLPAMDFTQSHLYVGSENIERIAAEISREQLLTYGKPTLNGEFGINPANIALSSIDPTGIYVHNTIWATTFSGAMGAGATWWWDNYIDPQDLYYHFAPLSAVTADIPFRLEDFRPAESQAGGGGGNGELVISPGAGWAEPTEAMIVVDEHGNLSTSPSKLGQFLYGSRWNTQLRNPPTFEITLVADGRFTVKTGSERGTDPSVALYLDGSLVKDNRNAQTNSSYAIDVPAGTHRIKVDNLGTDWITIVAYEIEGLATSPHIAYVVMSDLRDQAAGYIHNQRYNWKRVGEEGAPPEVTDGTILVGDMQPGAYRVRYFDCLSGELVATDEQVVADEDGLLLAVPDFLWDLSFTAEYTGSSVATDDQDIASLDIRLFPNPVATGQTLNLDTRELPPGDYRLAIYTLNGQALAHTRFRASGQVQPVAIGRWPGGQYIFRLTNGRSFVVRMFVVAR